MSTVGSLCHACDSVLAVGRVAAWRERNRERVRVYERERSARRRRELRADRVAKGIYLDAAPFKAWLVAQKFEPGDLADLSEVAGLHRDTLDNVLGRKRLVALNTVDAALTARGCHVRDLYPDDYERNAQQ